MGCECDRYLEIWNLVFMQFNRDETGNMTPLPKPSIDTGLGLERMVTLLQDLPNNYETDLILPIINKAEVLAEKKLGDREEDDVAMKVIADHSRAAAFLINDGVLPSNEGRGYVLRRIMRRAIRYGRNLGLVKPFLHQTASVVFDIMKEAYPNLKASQAFITNVIQNEEARFSETLDYGLRLLNDTLADIKARGDERVPGDVIFKLYDTYGFPVDIVRDVVRDERMTLDMEGFDAAMDGQRKRSRSVVAFSEISDAYRDLTIQGFIPEFVGYERTETRSSIKLIVENGKAVPAAVKGRDIEVVTETTPFYGEAGGQLGDTGRIYASDGNTAFEMTVEDTIKDPTGLIIHKGTLVSGTIKQNDTAVLQVNSQKRVATALNHTATHILHYALRKVLGEHVKQAGSSVGPERFRFDFTHFSRVEEDVLNEIETLVNERIRDNVVVQKEEMDAEEALDSGATALFEEKYGDRVRVISLSDFSRELCGGTHTSQTGDIGLFKIVSESSVASGVRRIEALTGPAAVAFVQHSADLLHESALLLREKAEALPQRIEKLLKQQKETEKEVGKLKDRISELSSEEAGAAFKSIDGTPVLVKRVEVESPAALRIMADRFKDKMTSGIVVLGGVSSGKALLIAVVTKDLAGKFHAGNIIKHVAGVVGGGGGGRPDMAQAGGPQPENLDKALAAALEMIKGVS